MIAPAPTQTLRPIRTGRPNSRPEARLAGWRGWSAARICTPGPICVQSPMATSTTEDRAVEIQEYASTEANDEVVIPMEWRPDKGAIFDSGEAFDQ